MLTKSQKRTLANLVRQNQSLLFAKFGPGITRKRKEEIWEAIRQKLISMGAELPDVRYVRDFEWGNLKRAATKRCAENRMTELDQVVMDTVTGISSHFESPNAESIEVTPTIYQNEDFENHDLTSESNSVKVERTVTSKFTPINPSSYDDSGLSNGHSDFHADQFGADYPVFPDPEIREMQKQKIQLETEHLRIQMNELREKSRREKEKFRLESEKMKQELILVKLKVKEVKARTEYFVAAKKSILENPNVKNIEPTKICFPETSETTSSDLSVLQLKAEMIIEDE